MLQIKLWSLGYTYSFRNKIFLLTIPWTQNTWIIRYNLCIKLIVKTNIIIFTCITLRFLSLTWIIILVLNQLWVNLPGLYFIDFENYGLFNVTCSHDYFRIDFGW